MSAALSVQGLSAGYGGIRVLDGIALEVPAGASSAYHDTASKPGKPDSAIVGTSGKSGVRFALATPRARSFPAWMCGSAADDCANMNAIWPPSRSRSAGAVPL